MKTKIIMGNKREEGQAFFRKNLSPRLAQNAGSKVF